MTTRKTVSRDHIRRIHLKYYDTTNYIAIMVTIGVLLQLWWMLKGQG